MDFAVGFSSILMLVLLFMKVPVFIAILGAAVSYFAMHPELSQAILVQRVLAGSQSIPLLAIPFFVCAGVFMNYTGVTKRIVAFCESIVGNIQDEYDNEDEEISRIDDATFTIDGTTDIEEVGDLIGVTFPEGDYDTLGGYIISRLGFLPSDGEMNSLEFENFRFTVLSVEDRRIGKVKVEILPGAKTEKISENETDSHEDV